MEEGPYHYAAGKYEKNADGYPVEKYVYEQPLTDNDDVLSKWTTCYTPQYIPEDGWGSIPVWQGVREYTGVHIEYNIVDSANRSQNFSVLLASVKLNDEEREESTELMTDLNTYYTENYVAFVDGSKPMSEWDSYISDVYSFGYGRIQELYQQAYDRFVSGQ